MLTKPLPGVMDDPFHPLSQGCVCHLLMNEGAGNLAYDVSGHGNSGTLKNMLPNIQGSKWQGSKFGGGLSFDGTDDYVDCGNDSSFNITDTITIEVWAKISNLAFAFNFLYPFVNTNNRWGFRIESNGVVIFFSKRSGVEGPSAIGATIVNDNKWHHIVAVRDGNTYYVYVDGTQDGSDTGTGQDLNLNMNWFLGCRNCAGTPDEFEDGSIDNVKINNRALSTKEIKMSYENPFCNLIQIPIWKRLSLAGLNIPRAMQYYKRLRDG